jgi:hypothetical protein
MANMRPTEKKITTTAMLCEGKEYDESVVGRGERAAAYNIFFLDFRRRGINDRHDMRKKQGGVEQHAWHPASAARAFRTSPFGFRHFLPVIHPEFPM